MDITVRLTRDENVKYFGKTEITIDLEKYVKCVTATEIGSTYFEACKAQAVAARTIALPYSLKNKVITDTSPQAFRASRYGDAFKLAQQATTETAGQVLYYGNQLADPASYSASNGGRTTSSKDRWGTEKPWLIEKDDPWDKGKKRGHGVGMSQVGAMAMSQACHSYKEILEFYYPGTHIEVAKEGGEKVAYATVKASYLIEKFRYMVDKHWKYVTNGASEGAVDCSGAFTYWYNQAGSYMYHGSNTMYRKYAPLKGKIGEIELVPGMAVYKRRVDGKEPAVYKSDGLGNFYHVGLYLGDGMVAEAKGTNYGCVYSKLDEWTYCSTLKYTEYDVKENDETQSFEPFTAIVTSNAKAINFRNKPSTSGTILGTIPKGTKLTVKGEDGTWYKVTYNGQTGWASSNLITPETLVADMTSSKTLQLDVSDAQFATLLNFLKTNKISYVERT